ncbi:MAG: GNAT family N-acetyltransferase [Candidatus Thorarchaeota archaeon SMTZ1-45]|nr:MAG: hypothetical protein AM325_16875 [Candidatus Thorarchaeota archaeon SMTZ1-45]
MEGGFRIEPLKEEDFNEIAELLNQTFGASRTRTYNLWKYEQTPPNQVLVVKDTSTSKVAGFVAQITLPIILGEEVYVAVQSVDGVVHPQFRGQGIFYDLCNESYRTSRENGAALVIAWTERYGGAWRVNIKKHGFLDIGLMKVLVYPIKPFRAVRWLGWGRLKSFVVGAVLWCRKILKHPRNIARLDLILEKGKWDYDGFSSCWKESLIPNAAAINKSSEFYKRRFSKSLWPTQEFYPISVREKDKIVCFAICITYTSKEGTSGIIADLHCIDGNDEALRLLIKECIEHFKAEGADYVRGWAKKSDWILKILVNSGFIIRDGRECLIMSPLSDDVTSDSPIFDFRLWDLDLCDSDHV